MAGKVVIVGAGQAASSTAGFLRQFGHEGPIVIIGDEALAPYQRPPLSKAWLKGEIEADELLLRADDFYALDNIDLQTGVRALELDLAGRRVVTDAGAETYDQLVLATGARARTLPMPGSDLAGVHTLRTAADALAIKAELAPGRRLAVIGAGYVGLEVAASARALGTEVVVIEREPRVLARVAAPPLSAFFETYHREHGVAFELGAHIAGLEGASRVHGVRLADGRLLVADVVLVGVGAIPNTELAEAAGIACANGIVVDLEARTSAPHVFAAGDCTFRPLPLYHRTFRLESVPNAIEQGRQAAAAITGRPAPAAECPWFWSDQYDLKLQIAGIAFDADQLVTRGEPASARFAVFHLKDGQILAVEAVNAAAEFMGGRMLILSGKTVDPARLADPAIPMKQVA